MVLNGYYGSLTLVIGNIKSIICMCERPKYSHKNTNNMHALPRSKTKVNYSWCTRTNTRRVCIMNDFSLTGSLLFWGKGNTM